jgi:ATP-dependent Lon protease
MLVDRALRFDSLVHLNTVSHLCFSTLPLLETPYPILVLVGPQGVGKKSLAQKLVEELPDYFGYA